MTSRKNGTGVAKVKDRPGLRHVDAELEAELTIAAWAPGRRRYERFKALLAERDARRSA